MESKLRVIALSGFFVPAYRGGGPIRTLEAMADAHRESIEFSVVTTNTDLGLPEPLGVQTGVWTKVGSANCFYIDWSDFRKRLAGIGMAVQKKPDYIYINSLFSFWFSIFPVLLSRFGLAGNTQLILAPRGELGHGALLIKRNKKRSFLKIARLTGLHRSVIWHASSGAEELEIQEAFPGARVVVRENETALPAESIPPKLPASTNPSLQAVYIGRLSTKKGVTSLLSALGHVSSPIRLDIYGAPESEGYREELIQLCDALPTHIDAKLHGPLPHEFVLQAFGQHELFICPTNHENFGHTIAESLAASCPVMIRDVTPFSPLIRRGAGVLVEEDDSVAWSEAIDKYAQLSTQERLRRRELAGVQYNVWRRQDGAPSIFDLCHERYGPGSKSN